MINLIRMRRQLPVHTGVRPGRKSDGLQGEMVSIKTWLQSFLSNAPAIRTEIESIIMNKHKYISLSACPKANGMREAFHLKSKTTICHSSVSLNTQLFFIC